MGKKHNGIVSVIWYILVEESIDGTRKRAFSTAFREIFWWTML